jgi:hypothetical protein
MKYILTSAFLCLAVTAFAQDTTKTKSDTTSYIFGHKTYDARIGRYVSFEDSLQNNPYKFADTNTTTLPANEPKKKTNKLMRSK